MLISLQVIYELTQGEKQLIEDLSLVKKVRGLVSKIVLSGVLTNRILIPTVFHRYTMSLC